MCTYSALPKFWTEANGSGMKLRWIFRVLGCAGTLISGIARWLRHWLGVLRVLLVVLGKRGIVPLAPFYTPGVGQEECDIIPASVVKIILTITTPAVR